MPQISNYELGLMKGIMAHTDLNNQQILSLFSHIHRDLNSRDITFIRSGSLSKYKKVKAFTKPKVLEFLSKYNEVIREVEGLGIGSIDNQERMVHKSIEIIKSAIIIFNNSSIKSRSETFIVLAIIAWTYLVHARFRRLGIEPIYLDDENEPIIADGEPKLWDLAYCITRTDLGLSVGARNNLKYNLAVRHKIEHRSTQDINDEVQSKCQACALNFLEYCKDWFGNKFDFSADASFAIQLRPLTLQSKNVKKGGKPRSGDIEALNIAFEASMNPAEFNDLEYAFRVHVVPNVSNNPKYADQAVTYSPVGSDVEVAIKKVERPKFRQKEMLRLLSDQGCSLNAHEFQQIWKKHKLKNKGKGLAIELGNQWFWYEEALAKFIEHSTQT